MVRENPRRDDSHDFVLLAPDKIFGEAECRIQNNASGGTRNSQLLRRSTSYPLLLKPRFSQFDVPSGEEGFSRGTIATTATPSSSGSDQGGSFHARPPTYYGSSAVFATPINESRSVPRPMQQQQQQQQQQQISRHRSLPSLKPRLSNFNGAWNDTAILPLPAQIPPTFPPSTEEDSSREVVTRMASVLQLEYKTPGGISCVFHQTPQAQPTPSQTTSSDSNISTRCNETKRNQKEATQKETQPDPHHSSGLLGGGEGNVRGLESRADESTTQATRPRYDDASSDFRDVCSVGSPMVTRDGDLEALSQAAFGPGQKPAEEERSPPGHLLLPFLSNKDSDAFVSK